MKIRTPKDFEQLSDEIFKVTHQKLSPTTLKRIWGYVQDGSNPRESTLDIMAQFLNYQSWEHFCTQVTSSSPADFTPVPPPSPSKPWKKWKWIFLSLMVLLLALLTFFIINLRAPSAPRTSLVLHQGDTFASYYDYLKLFGVTDTTDLPYFKPVPHYPNIILWGPEYQHPHWHNTGSKDSLMPTITERWDPGDCDPELVRMKNAEHYYAGRRLNDIRITFMKNFNSPGYTFLGVYRFSMEHSDTTHVVFERVANECDLNNLDYLLQLRN